MHLLVRRSKADECNGFFYQLLLMCCFKIMCCNELLLQVC
jgi:hypothetical protein